jgi:hypothetical protein
VLTQLVKRQMIINVADSDRRYETGKDLGSVVILMLIHLVVSSLKKLIDPVDIGGLDRSLRTVWERRLVKKKNYK